VCIMQDVGQLARASGPKRVSECAQWASARACVVHMRVVHMRAGSTQGRMHIYFQIKGFENTTRT
jgi:hypothetical protein